ncbi:uncharacterized protein DNG_08181 [Cephalotrichum gorgonifer]|uniref:Uncharacterized protein n=1 Tax=Cephalotrichum gorgonifer TaxID=2041049 RepID=A0AAE8N4M2_9PEZI|nr:uncharacterized protein DNG_08181 [Cephalotrichum gorgonifer]
MDKFLSASINDVRRLCEYGFYDYIIVGSGIGGGVLAQSLLENSATAKVLLIERGGPVFSSHCLNGPRPHWSHRIPAGPSQDVDIVYNALKSPVSTVSQHSYPYVGGEVHCLGGRGNVWGLYTPKIHPEDLAAYFPEEVISYLQDQGGYDKAYQLLSNDPYASLDRPYPENNASISASVVDGIGSLMQNLNEGTKDWGCSFTNCPLAAEFTSSRPDRALYQFPMGAFSPVNWILDRVYNRDERLTVLPNTRVLTVNRQSDDKSAITSITTVDASGTEQDIPVGKAVVILSGGTLGSPSIALRSGLGEGCQPASESGNLIGKGLMDHDIWGTRFEVLQGPHLASLNSQPLKINSWVKLGDDPVLVNIAVNADTFMGRTQANKLPAVYLSEALDEVPESEFNEALKKGSTKSVVQIAYSLSAPLDDRNRVLNLPGPTPTIQIETIKDHTQHIPQLQRLARAIGAALGGKDGGDEQKDLPLPSVGKAPFGVVAHEVGTMRMGKDGSGVVDENLKINGLKNLYVCDLSVFPVSPGANPSLTLAALAQRLAGHLLSSSTS